MVSVELVDERADMEQIGKQYCNGNLSRHLRNLIWNHHKNIQTIQKTEQRQNFFQTAMFLFLGVTLLTLAASQIFNIDQLVTINLSLLIFSGIIIIIYVLTNYKKIEIETNEVIMK